MFEQNFPPPQCPKYANSMSTLIECLAISVFHSRRFMLSKTIIKQILIRKNI